MLSLLTACVLLVAPPADAPTYAIVVSEATYGDEQWREVVESLREKHDGTAGARTSSCYPIELRTSSYWKTAVWHR